jgi:hypothetical protein
MAVAGDPQRHVSEYGSAAAAGVAPPASLVIDASGLAPAGFVSVEGLQPVTTDVTTLRGEILIPTGPCLPQALA